VVPALALVLTLLSLGALVYSNLALSGIFVAGLLLALGLYRGLAAGSASAGS
jgi:hypothetical protein